MEKFKIFTVKKDRGSGCGQHGSESGLHHGEWFSVALMSYNNLNFPITQIYFQKSDWISDGLVLEIEGDKTSSLETDEDCLKAVCFHNPAIVFEMMKMTKDLGIKQGREEFKEDLRKLFGI